MLYVKIATLILLAILIIGLSVYFYQINLNQRNAAEAHTALVNYFSLLHNRQYAQAIKYFGSDWQTLYTWNPDVSAANKLELIGLGCEHNGWRCLPIRQAILQSQSANEYTFVVEFQNDDGSLFKLGPCCGETESETPPQTEFTYVVKKSGGQFLVATPPVYQP